MANLGNVNKLVTIRGESYALDEIPPAESGIVKAKIENLHASVDLNALVKDLGRVGGFIRVAYNAVGAAGYEHTETKIKIQRLGYDIAELCDESVITVAKFDKASGTILQNLKSSYGYLLDNLEKMAAITMSSVCKIAEDMEKAAQELSEKFKEQTKNVKLALEDTQHAETSQATKVKEGYSKQIELDAQIELEEKLFKEYQEKEMEAEARRQELERKEDKAISDISESSFANTMKVLANGFTKPIGVKFFETAADNAKTKADKYRQYRLEASEAEQELREKRHNGMARMSAFMAQLKQCKNDVEMAECAVKALQEAIGALRHLSAVMMRASTFWKLIKEHCHSLAESTMKSQIEMALEFDKEERLQTWTSNSFKEQAVQFYSGWVALKSVCEEHIKQIKMTQQDLYRYITENPTNEQCKRDLPDLAEKFMAELKLEQEAAKKKESETKKQIKDLSAPKEN